MRRITLAVALAGLLGCSRAYAADWITFDENSHCKLASKIAAEQKVPVLASPDALVAYRKGIGLFVSTTIARFTNGGIMAMIVSIQPDGDGLVYFANPLACELYRKLSIENGSMEP